MGLNVSMACESGFDIGPDGMDVRLVGTFVRELDKVAKAQKVTPLGRLGLAEDVDDMDPEDVEYFEPETILKSLTALRAAVKATPVSRHLESLTKDDLSGIVEECDALIEAGRRARTMGERIRFGYVE